VIYFSFL
jgi:U3 small nucleolar RNA-associated protein 25